MAQRKVHTGYVVIISLVVFVVISTAILFMYFTGESIIVEPATPREVHVESVINACEMYYSSAGEYPPNLKTLLKAKDVDGNGKADGPWLLESSLSGGPYEYKRISPVSYILDGKYHHDVMHHDSKLYLPEKFWEAVTKGDIEVLSHYLDSGKIDINARSRLIHWTPLHQAAAAGQAKAVEFLLDKGAVVNAKNEMGHTPLDIAIERDHKDIALLLRKHDGKTGMMLRD